MKFQLTATDPKGKARAGVISTAHGDIETPIFMPVGTVGTVKAVHFEELRTQIEAQIILGNTYHLYLRPGLDIIRAAGGLHQFNTWDRPILTDSGGYQVYSLADRRKLTEEGARFSSHIDGSKHMFTPEYVMDIQRVLGSDIVMALDECTPYPCDHAYAKKSMEMTHRWLARCCTHFDQTEPLYGFDQALFPIVQGSTYRDLRIQSAEKIASFEREGNAIGGLSVGEPHEMMYEMTELVCGILPADKPRYLMGVGTPANILECIDLGVDMFDCVMPTRNARNGMLFTNHGIINIKNKKWEMDFSPIDADANADTSRIHTKAYLRHLFVAGEYLGPMIASINNLSFYLQLVKAARKEIIAGNYKAWKERILPVISRRL
jgi:queuine tRNA-ribosyltransferase